jgi:hypothetical protein
MLSRCVNPACRHEFNLFCSGDLYALERRAADTEFFWLCSVCSPRIEVYLDPTSRVSVRLRGRGEAPQPPHPEVSLRQLGRRASRRIPWRENTPTGEPRPASPPALSPFAAATEAA